MSAPRLTVVRSNVPPPAAGDRDIVLSDAELRRLAFSGRILRHLFRYREARLLTERIASAGRPMLAWVLRATSRGRCAIVDARGTERTITLPLLVRWTAQLIRERCSIGALLRAAEREADALSSTGRAPGPLAIERGACVLYLRTDLSFGIRAGGSVGHIAGVVNELAEVVGPALVLTTTNVPTLRRSVEEHRVDPPEAFWNFDELPTIVLNEPFVDAARVHLAGRRVALVYHRYSLNSFAGVRLARELGVPLVLEYNGSEIWMARHWSRPLTHEALAEKIELLNVKSADLVVVVSRAMRDELIARGVDAGRVLVNPNAVDPVRYSPSIDGSRVRSAYGLDGKLVIGFIGTFGPWHGAEVLADAFGRLVARRPELRERVRLLMIGSGVRLDATRRMVREAGLEDAVEFTGLVDQGEGPQHLAACDVLASPHVPNPDGTPFFGSPTKLFEYMAMGKAIVASDLDQIGEMLRHGETAWLVRPGDPDALAAGLERVIDDPALRGSLGEAARRDAVAHHTWRAHVARMLDTLERRLHSEAASLASAS